MHESIAAPTLSIAGWADTFENADTRKRERLKFFHAPSGTDSRGYLALVSHFPQDKALAAFGVFQALCQLMATLRKDIRGSFLNNDRSPMDLQHLAALLRIDQQHLDAAISILCDPKVKWLRMDGINGRIEESIVLAASPVMELPVSRDEWNETPPAPVVRQKPEHRPTLPPAEELPAVIVPPPVLAMKELEKKVASLRPEWARMPHFSGAEMYALHACASSLQSVSEDDWKLMQSYMQAVHPQGSGYWQPKSRSQFLNAPNDVLVHAIQWASKTGGGHKPKNWSV